jgi:hypothetical protein
MNKVHDPREVAEDIRLTLAAMDKTVEKARKSKAFARKVLESLTHEASIARLEASFPAFKTKTQTSNHASQPRAAKPKTSTRKKLKTA